MIFFMSIITGIEIDLDFEVAPVDVTVDIGLTVAPYTALSI